jgi:murein DD-endopeptidase MepM/ murein hydrolase activator NlpD
MAAMFAAGGAAGWWTRGRLNRSSAATAAAAPMPAAPVPAVPAPISTTGTPETVSAARTGTTSTKRSAPATHPTVVSETVAALRARHLQLPIDTVRVDTMRDQFAGTRENGRRGHEAVDLMAPRNTPVHAVDAGTIARLFQSRQGGTTIYQFDPERRFCYYYAHLESYAAKLYEGQAVSRGEVIGFVGTSGNAPADVPHLHFAIFELNADRHWWQGTAVDPYLAFGGSY